VWARRKAVRFDSLADRSVGLLAPRCCAAHLRFASSPLLANIYLHPLDQELEKRELSFVRYADDIAIFCSSERSAARVKESVIEWIEKHLKLEVNREKSGHGPSDQSGLLGFRLQKDGQIGIAPKSIAALNPNSGIGNDEMAQDAGIDGRKGTQRCTKSASRRVNERADAQQVAPDRGSRYRSSG
jgi:hypothetical protein